MEIKTNLSRILGERRITQSELAEKAGLAKATIRAVYYDTWKQLGRDTIKKICAALDIDISEMFEIVGDDKAA
ncbi:helix-turn-helix transcriptional regulator [bacterium]|nr:helix-turn-helix transcriptional regulator [bacterium]